MKRTITISLWLALGSCAVAQNPAVMQKNVQSAVKTSASTQAAGTAAKPSPTTVKVVAVSTSKPAVAGGEAGSGGSEAFDHSVKGHSAGKARSCGSCGNTGGEAGRSCSSRG